MGILPKRPAVAQLLKEKIRTRQAKVGIIGLGYVGLPLGVEFAKAGFAVTGIDLSDSKIARVNAGDSYVGDVANAVLAPLVESGKLTATTDFAAVRDLDTVNICVPTPLRKTKDPDMSYIVSACGEIAKYLHAGMLVILESTTYPGTTDEVMLPILEASGLKVEQDFFLAHSPERVDPGNERYSTKNINKVVGGIGPESCEVAELFYKQTVEQVITVTNTKAAEMVKVFENTFRAVNIALVNEFMLLCDRMQLNVWEVLDAAFTKPFGIMPFYPGPGVGGHCIPIDPHYLEWKAKELQFNTHFISLAGEINRKMPFFVREKASRLLNGMGKAMSQATILVVGVAYKKDISDYRESPSMDVIRLLREEGVTVLYHDPHVPFIEEHGLTMVSHPLNDTVMEAVDLVVIATDHSKVDYEELVNQAPHVLDTRNVTRHVVTNRERITLL
ncbi:MAG: nucleotide sugar dehydrogenase [Tumebacillaceae bacterium]